MSEKFKSLRWRREKRATGLRSACQGERGWDLWRGEVELAWVRPLVRGWTKNKIGYYFYAAVNGENINTANCDPYLTMDDAKAAAKKWVMDSDSRF